MWKSGLLFCLPFLVWAQSIQTIESLAVGSVVDFPPDFKLSGVNVGQRLAIHKFRDRETESNCSFFLSGSEAPVSFAEATSWTVVQNQATRASSESCRRELRQKMKSEYDRAISALDQDWISSSPVTRSLQKRQAMEKYLRISDQLLASQNPCEEFLKAGDEKPQGPVLVTLESARHPQRRLQLYCDKKNVPVVALNNQGLGVQVGSMANARSPVSSGRAPASFRAGASR